MHQLLPPTNDPTSIFELFRGSYGSELLTAAVSHFHVFERMHGRDSEDTCASYRFEQLRQELGLERRPAHVLFTALRAMKLLDIDQSGAYRLTGLAEEHLVSGGKHFVGDYIGLAAGSAGVVEMVARLRANHPARAEQSDTGAAFIYRDGMESAMEHEASARRLTLALAGRAKNVAPVLADRLNLTEGTLLDLGGGTGIYSIACLRKNPHLKAIVFDRQEVLKVASEFAINHGVADRLQLVSGDMFADELPQSNAILLSNILHDWDEPECRTLIARCAAALPKGGRLFIHDVFLDDDLGGPLPIALYSAALFTLTEGRAYSAAEYRQWCVDASLIPGKLQPTLIHCGVLEATSQT